MPGLPLDHIPADGEQVNVVEEPLQTESDPLIAAGVVFTVTIVVATQLPSE